MVILLWGENLSIIATKTITYEKDQHDKPEPHKDDLEFLWEILMVESSKKRNIYYSNGKQY